MKYDKILLEHGGGGLLSNELISEYFLPRFQNPYLARLEDSAVLTIGNQKICFTTDSYVVSPVFFPGGNIGSLAVHGTVNDLSVCGGKPLHMSCGFILEEGFPFASLEIIIQTMAEAANVANVKIVTGDTKVVARGAADGIFINTSGIGIVEYPGTLSVKNIQPGDVVIVNGTIGDHGAAIIQARENLSLTSDILSDSAPLNDLIADILQASPNVHCMRDATRGGLGAILAEIAKSAQVRIDIDEKSIPIQENVRGICEILGFDPLFLANEGKMILFCPKSDADKVLTIMRNHKHGQNAAVIGMVSDIGKGRVVLKTCIGGERIVDLPTGELVPRIC
ncbi:MAG TPA: hydrogenase expression/formation protein HypE [Syntrophaceae bacterium]|jgi:hydrogenase expression/formation protein HypE|nr:hydrogenase expression/formation protein HypE [Syntrophaceae bacterium]HCX01770.1 hydrogenase expression/formation protein HypE [Syntrophaceae bacterium]